MPVTPRKPAPALKVETLDGETFDLAGAHPRTFTMVVFYRGLHCPVCSKYLKDLDNRLGDFRKSGVEVIAVSCDDHERAVRSRDEWGLKELRVGYGLTLESARDWGLFVSSSIKEGEPGRFSEPGLFLIEPDGTLYAASIQSMPFARPSLAEVRQAIDFISRENYPARGEAA